MAQELQEFNTLRPYDYFSIAYFTDVGYIFISNIKCFNYTSNVNMWTYANGQIPACINKNSNAIGIGLSFYSDSATKGEGHSIGDSDYGTLLSDISLKCGWGPEYPPCSDP